MIRKLARFSDGYCTCEQSQYMYYKIECASTLYLGLTIPIPMVWSNLHGNLLLLQKIYLLTARIPLNGSNYPTWKILCRMMLMKGLWKTVTGEETEPNDEGQRARFTTRRDQALATVVLSVDSSILYIIGNPEDPVIVWKVLDEKKTWARRLHLCWKLH